LQQKKLWNLAGPIIPYTTLYIANTTFERNSNKIIILLDTVYSSGVLGCS
jgi:hypothetical protein